MKHPNRNRWIAYPAAAAFVLMLLLAAKLRTEGEPELGTLINGADILAKVGAHDKAIQECEKVLERDPGNLQAHLILAFAHDRLSNYEDSLRSYDRALALCEEEELGRDIHLAIADLHRKHERFHAAADKTREIEQRYGCSPDVTLVHALAVEKMGDVDEAADLLSRSVVDHPEDKRSRFHLGRVCLEHGRLVEAEEAFESLSEEPGAPYGAWYQLAVTRAWLGRDTAMYEALEQAAQSYPALTTKSILEEDAFADFHGHPRFEDYLGRLFETTSRADT